MYSTLTIMDKSRFIIVLLRHKPEILNLSMDNKGWVLISELISKVGIDFNTLLDIVRLDDRQRFQIDNLFIPTKIRATQGHTVKVEIEPELVLIKEPLTLYYGTSKKVAKGLQKGKEGLTPVGKQYLHLTSQISLAYRKGKEFREYCIISMQYKGMEDYPLYRLPNGIYLTEKVPFELITNFKYRGNGKSKILQKPRST